MMDMQATATTTGGTLSFGRDTYPVPADFVTFINDTQWDRGNHWKLQGPASPQEDEWLRSGIVSTGPRRWFRQVGRGLDVFRIWPPPAAGDVPGPLAYEYLSSYWAQGPVISGPSGLTSIPQAQFTTDADTCIFGDRLMIEGLKWRFYAAKGFDFSHAVGAVEPADGYRDCAGWRQPGAGMTRRRYPMLISPANVQMVTSPDRVFVNALRPGRVVARPRFPVATGGWNAVDALDAMAPGMRLKRSSTGSPRRLYNRLRRGYTEFCDIGGTIPVTALAAYNGVTDGVARVLRHHLCMRSRLARRQASQQASRQRDGMASTLPRLPGNTLSPSAAPIPAGS